MMDRRLRSSRIETAPSPSPAGATEPAAGTLSARLREGTQDLHRVAERSGAMATLLRGTMDRRDYAVLLQNLQAIYGALEAGLDRHATRFNLPLTQLRRAEALRQDLVDLDAPSNAAALAPATLRYVQRLERLGAPDAPDSLLLLAHAYVRYLGDLHGGQLLKRRVTLSLNLCGSQGTGFYEFGSPSQVSHLIRAVRAGLDEPIFNSAEVLALVDEARLAFQLHVELFAQLPHD